MTMSLAKVYSSTDFNTSKADKHVLNEGKDNDQ